VKKLFFAAYVFASVSAAFPYTFEQLQRRLDSLELLQQEAMRRGGDGKEFFAEKKQLQMAIETKNSELKAEVVKRIEEGAVGDEVVKKPPSKSDGKNFFANRPLLDNLVIIMGAIALLAAMFLVFARIFLALSKKNKEKKILTAKKQSQTEVKKEISSKPTNLTIEIDRNNKETEQNLEKITYSIRDLAKKIPPKDVLPKPSAETRTPFIVTEEKPKKMRAVELKNEIVRRFEDGEDTATIAHDFSMSKDQVVMILNLAGRK